MIAKLSEKFNTKKILLIISGLILAGEVYLYTAPLISSGACILYLVLLGELVGTRISTEKKIQQWGGIAIALSLISLVGVGFYYPYRLTPEVSLIALYTPLLIILKKKKNTVQEKHILKDAPPRIFFYALIFLECILILFIVLARNGELMQSPWMAFSPIFFILFGTTTSLCIYILAKKTYTRGMLGASIILFFIIYSIAAIVYKLGFGFDGFIHRAAESWILENGFITPKEPFYLGQYSLVVTLSRITGITLSYIDIFLVPMLASFSIPSLTSIVLSKAWHIEKQKALGLSLGIPGIFFLSFNLTTPHNLALLLCILTVLALVGYLHRTLPYSLVLILAITSLATHPLLGAPLMILVLAGAWIQRAKTRQTRAFIYAGIIVGMSVIPLIMFGVQQWRNGYGLPSLINPFSHIQLFLDFFRRPFWYSTTRVIWYVDLLYVWQYALTPIAIMCALAGYWLQRKKIYAPLLISASFGLVCGAFLLRTLITFPNVSFHEQSNYPLRLLIGSIMVLIPLALYGLYIFLKKITVFLQQTIHLQKTLLTLCIAILGGILLTLSFYLGYPQYNSKVHFPGFNVTEYDKKVVEWIDSKNPQTTYVVLSSILTAVTALTEHPFAQYVDTPMGPQFYYAIPSGGPLQRAYEKMLYEGQQRETIEEVFALAPVQTVYFVVPWYWKNHIDIIEGAKKSADSWHAIEDKMWIFEYSK